MKPTTILIIVSVTNYQINILALQVHCAPTRNVWDHIMIFVGIHFNLESFIIICQLGNSASTNSQGYYSCYFTSLNLNQIVC